MLLPTSWQGSPQYCRYQEQLDLLQLPQRESTSLSGVLRTCSNDMSRVAHVLQARVYLGREKTPRRS
jgi:hypothetical protein